MSRPQPLSPPTFWGIEGSRLHHWLPRPCWVPKTSIGRGSKPLPCALCGKDTWRLVAPAGLPQSCFLIDTPLRKDGAANLLEPEDPKE